MTDIVKQAPSLPIKHHHLVLYVAHLADKAYSPATIATNLSALSFLHKLYCLPDPTTSFVVSKMLKGYKKLAPPPAIRLPITLPILQQLTAALPHLLHSHYEIKLYTSMYAMAFYACLRIGELTHKPATQDHNLQISDIQILVYPEQTRHDVLVSFRSHKHSTPHRISQLQIQDSYSIHPVAVLIEYLKLRGPNPGPLYIWQNGKPITYKQFVATLRDTLNFAGYPPSVYKSHSFRIGRATLALQQGYSDLQIMKLGRWASTAHLKYLRPPTMSS